MSTYTIAEIGACHDGDRAAMSKAIRVAKACGADAVKFQWVSDPVRMAKRRGKAYEDGYGEIYRRYLAWPAEWHAGLRAECDEAGIDYMCTAYLPEDVETIAPFVRHFKIASFEAGDWVLWEAILLERKFRQHVVASLGMGMDPQDAHRLLDDLESTFRSFCYGSVRLLRCVSSYPAPHTALNLGRLNLYSGLSDHTAPDAMLTGALAVAAAGRRQRPFTIEAHFRLDTTEPENPDYPHAMSPHQFSEYIANIRFAEECLGNGDTSMHECEIPMARYKMSASGATTDQQDSP